MKRIVTLMLISLLTTTSLLAQESLREVVKEYQRQHSEYTLVIPSFLIKVGLAFGDMEAEEREVLEQIEDMKIVISENRYGNLSFPRLDEGLKQGNFVELMTVQEQGDKVRMIMNQKNKRKSEMLMIVESDDETVLMLFNFHGEPDFKKFMALVD